MSLGLCSSPSIQVWLSGAVGGGAMSMSLFSRLSADCDFNNRGLSTENNNEKQQELQR